MSEIIPLQEIEEHWVEEKNGKTGEIKMVKAKKENPVVWKETVCILEAPPVVAAEGSTLSFNASEKVGIKDKMA